MDFKDVIGLAWKRRGLIVAVTALCVAASAVFAFTQPKRYASTATLAVTPDVAEGQGFVSTDNLSPLLRTYAVTARSEVIRRRAALRTGREITSDIDTDSESGAGILHIEARASSPEIAREDAEAISDAFLASIRSNQLVVAMMVNPPLAVATPVQPRPALILGTALPVGFALGFMIALFLAQWRRRVETSEDVSLQTSAPVLARVPHASGLSREGARGIWEAEDGYLLQETFRTLRTNLQFLLREPHNSVLEITSAVPSEGKSTVTANLGIACARAGIETIIVDADLRRPRQHELFGLDNGTGVSNVVAAGFDADLDPALQPSGYDDLWLLTSGPTPADPTEDLAIRIHSVLDRLRSHNALILVDSPPVLAYNDARLVAPHTDGLLLVVKAGALSPSTFGRALEQLTMLETPLVGVVLNRLRHEPLVSYGYYEGAPRARRAIGR